MDKAPIIARPFRYRKGRLFLVPKDVRVEGHSSQMPFETTSMSATIALLNRSASEGDGSSQTLRLDKRNSEAVE
jgi:hypothetical protein